MKAKQVNTEVYTNIKTPNATPNKNLKLKLRTLTFMHFLTQDNHWRYKEGDNHINSPTPSIAITMILALLDGTDHTPTSRTLSPA